MDKMVLTRLDKNIISDIEQAVADACKTEWRNKKSLENYYKIRDSDKYEQYKIKHRKWWYRRKEKEVK